MATSERNTPPAAWLLRVAWLVLPLTVGPLAHDALRDWSSGPRVVAEVLLWAGWAIGLLAVMAPRPLGLTAVRLLGGWAVGISLVAAPTGEGLDAAGALASSVLTSALVALPEIATWMAAGAAYGDERRFPLRTPPVIAWTLVPLSVLVAGTGIGLGPLLLADQRWIPGAAAVGVGVGVAVFPLRSLHALSRRWLILVPGGVVVHDPLTLSDPVLLRRERIESLIPIDASSGATLDLCLGATSGRVLIGLSEPVPVPVTRRRRTIDVVKAGTLVVSLARPGGFLREAQRRRLPVHETTQERAPT